MGKLFRDGALHRKINAIKAHSVRAELRVTVRQFTPNWFTVTMGTSILSLALNQFPVPLPGLHAVGEVP